MKKLLGISLLSATLISGQLLAASCGGKSDSGKMDSGMHGKSKSQNSHGSMKLVQKIIGAVSHTGINSDQAMKIADAIATFKKNKAEVKKEKEIPLDAFKNDKFDADAFRAAKDRKHNFMVQLQVQLFESIYETLDAEQKKIFKRMFTAPMIQKMLHAGQAKGCGGSAKSSCSKGMKH